MPRAPTTRENQKGHSPGKEGEIVRKGKATSSQQAAKPGHGSLDKGEFLAEEIRVCQSDWPVLHDF